MNSGRPPKQTSTSRYDLRRRVLITNLVQDRPGDRTFVVEPPPRCVRRWGYSDGSRTPPATPNGASRMKLPPLVTMYSPVLKRRVKSPRKLGSPRTNSASEDALAIKCRLRRSSSYREAVKADTSNEDASSLPPAAKRQRTEATEVQNVLEPMLSSLHLPARLQYGRPFAAPQPCHDRQPTSFQYELRRQVASTPVPQCPQMAPLASAVQARRSRSLETRNIWLLQQQLPPAVPAVAAANSLQMVSQGTQTSPLPKKGLLRRKSSLRQALERMLGAGKENDQIAPSSPSTRVKRRPSLVESFLLKRCNSSSEQAIPQRRRSTGVLHRRGSTKSSPKSSTPGRVKPGRAQSLRLRGPDFDPWG